MISRRVWLPTARTLARRPLAGRSGRTLPDAALIWGAPCEVGRVRQPLQPSLEGLPLPLTGGPVTSVSMSTRGHSHMRGLVAAGRVVRRERYRGSRSERGPVRAAHSAVAGWLLTLPSPARCSSTDAWVRRPGPRSGGRWARRASGREDSRGLTGRGA